MHQIPERCSECPFLPEWIEFDQLEIAKLEAELEDGITRASRFMEISEKTTEEIGQEKEFGAAPEGQLKYKEVEAAKRRLIGLSLEATDESISAVRRTIDKKIADQTEVCKRGPKTKKRYGLFGRRVIKCGSPRQRFASFLFVGEIPNENIPTSIE